MLLWLAWAALSGPPLDLNTATAEQLALLPGLGPTKAATIVKWRETHGAFSSLEGLLHVPHIGPGTLANLRPRLTVSDESEATSPPAPEQVNINTAAHATLLTLPGVGAKEAASIIEHRPFDTCQDLTRLPGFGPATVANIAGSCVAR